MWSDAPGRSVLRLPGFIVAVLALISQLALGATVLPDPSPADGVAALAAAMADCAPAAPAHHNTPRHDDGTLCPLSVALALPSVIITPAPTLPPPVLLQSVRIVARPPARAPPGRVLAAAFPRGPPALA